MPRSRGNIDARLTESGNAGSKHLLVTSTMAAMRARIWIGMFKDLAAVGVHGALEIGKGFVIHCWLSVWTDAWSVILQQILHTSTRKPVRTESDLLLSDGKLQHKHIPAAKKVTQTRLKNFNCLSMTWYQLKIMWRMHVVAPLTSKVCKTGHATLNAIACMCQTICDATSRYNSSNSVILRNSYISLHAKWTKWHFKYEATALQWPVWNCLVRLQSCEITMG